MRIERLLPLVLMPNIAMAGSGGGGIIVGLLVFLPILVWGLVKLWKFWFQMIFGGFNRIQPQPGGVHRLEQASKDCPFCAEPILAKAMKCKHCGSELS